MSTQQMSGEELAAAWTASRADAAGAYAAWSGAPKEARRLAYAAFVAAADREHAAERAYLTHLSAA